MTYREVARKLRGLGCEELPRRGGGSHRKWHNPATGDSLPKLADEPVEALGREAPIRAVFLDGLLHPDDVKDVLRWLNDPIGFRTASGPEEWAAFMALCQNRYGFHPEEDGPITAARLLGQRKGVWDTVWRRFAEAPTRYGQASCRCWWTRPNRGLRRTRPPKRLCARRCLA